MGFFDLFILKKEMIITTSIILIVLGIKKDRKDYFEWLNSRL
jgi:hypothetical protein